jgi:transcriptional antiterminator RfaH
MVNGTKGFKSKLNTPSSERWLAVYTKPKQEFRAQEHLINQGVKVFLPIMMPKKLSLKSTKMIQPKAQILFPRYLFINVNFANVSLTTLRSCRGVSRILSSSSGEPIPINTEIIEEIQKLAIEWQPPPKLSIGQEAVITSGPARGIHGVIQQLLVTSDGEERALILIDFLCKPQLWQIGVSCLNSVGTHTIS